MKKISMMIMAMSVIMLWAGMPPDEQVDQSVLISETGTPEIRALLEKMDNAKQIGDFDGFNQALDAYNLVKPRYETADGPKAVYNDDNGGSILWNGDILVDSAWNYDGLSMDVMNDGTIYLCGGKYSVSGSEAVIQLYRSVNGGLSWNPFIYAYWSGRNLIQPSLKVFEQADTTFVCIAFKAIQVASPYESDVLLWRLPIGGASTFPSISSVSGVNEERPSLDADDTQYSGAGYLYCGFESADSVAHARSLDRGVTFVDRMILGSGNPSYDYALPSIAYGWAVTADSCYIGATWVYTGGSTQQVVTRVRRSINFGTTWLPIQYLSSALNNDQMPVLKLTHGAVARTGCILFGSRDTTSANQDLSDFYTYDGGRSWSEDILYSGGTYAINPTLSVEDGPGGYYDGFFKGDFDDVRYKKAPFDNLPYAGWSFSTAISDGGDISDNTAPASAIRVNESCVAWKDITDFTWYKLMFDAEWLQTAVEEVVTKTADASIKLAPNPAKGNARLSYTVKTGGNVRIALYDVTGQLVKDIFNDNRSPGVYSLNLNLDIAAGVYFVKVVTADNNLSQKLVILQ